jgi:hypothetical protein
MGIMFESRSTVIFSGPPVPGEVWPVGVAEAEAGLKRIKKARRNEETNKGTPPRRIYYQIT